MLLGKSAHFAHFFAPGSCTICEVTSQTTEIRTSLIELKRKHRNHVLGRAAILRVLNEEINLPRATTLTGESLH